MLSQATGYATSALACVAAMGGKPALVKDLAEACSIPQSYLAKIVNVLAHRDIVQTQRGVGGGVSLSRPPHEITIRVICEALDDPVLQPRCMLGNAECSEDRACPAHQFCVSHRNELASFLNSTTIADIAAFETRRRWRAVSPERQSQETEKGPCGP